MIELKGMLIISGNGKNIGKTTLACRIIETFSQQTPITGLKVITYRKGIENCNQSNVEALEENFLITQEFDREISKDTARMLSAGASEVYMIRTGEEFLEEAVNEFFRKYGRDRIFVCESGSLNNIVKPGILIMVRSAAVEKEKENTEKTAMLADKVIFTKGNPREVIDVKLNLVLDQNQWKLKQAHDRI